MTAQAVEYDPTDLRGQEERSEELQRRAAAVDIERRKDLVWMLSGRRGRRELRRLLREAGFRMESDVVSTVLDRHYGVMCFQEGLRARGMQLIWPLMRLLASGELPYESFRQLMTETDA